MARPTRFERVTFAFGGQPPPIDHLRAKQPKHVRRLLDQGVRVTINSDDPSYFRGYINDNFKACQETFALTRSDLIGLARNSFTAAFLPEESKKRYLGMIDAYSVQ
jgi:adenine deaminase